MILLSLVHLPVVISDRNEVTLDNVSRHTRRRYECIASNGYPPDVARSFQLTIQYAPEVTLHFLSPTNDELTSSLVLIDHQPKEVRLKCRIVMNPFDQIYWMREKTRLINNQRIHQYVSTHTENYIIAELVLKDFSTDDQGDYTCVASNSLGIDRKTIQLLTAPTTTGTVTAIPTTTTVTTSTESTSTWPFMISRRKRPKHWRTTTLWPDETYQSTELLREMSISSSSNGK
jgi:hypothetical protein